MQKLWKDSISKSLYNQIISIWKHSATKTARKNKLCKDSFIVVNKGVHRITNIDKILGEVTSVTVPTGITFQMKVTVIKGSAIIHYQSVIK